MLGYVLPAIFYFKTFEKEFKAAWNDLWNTSSEDSLLMSRSRSESTAALGAAPFHSSAGFNSSSHHNDSSPSFTAHDADGDVTIDFTSLAFDEHHKPGSTDSRRGSGSGSIPQRDRRQQQSLTLLAKLGKFRKFVIPAFMIPFGFVALIVGVTTVLYDALS
jgi:hypothetical protein